MPQPFNKTKPCSRSDIHAVKKVPCSMNSSTLVVIVHVPCRPMSFRIRAFDLLSTEPQGGDGGGRQSLEWDSLCSLSTLSPSTSSSIPRSLFVTQGLPGKDGETGAAGPPGPAVSIPLSLYLSLFLSPTPILSIFLVHLKRQPWWDPHFP